MIFHESHMKHQALFSPKDKSEIKKLKYVSSAEILLDALGLIHFVVTFYINLIAICLTKLCLTYIFFREYS